MAPTSKPVQILLLSQPRTACHLLERMLTSGQSDVQICWHPFVAARPMQTELLREDSVAQGMPQSLRQAFAEQISTGNETWRKALDAAEAANNILFVHTHPHFALDPDAALEYVRSDWRNPLPSTASNYTLVDPALLLHPGTIPLFTFRHPASTAYTCYKSMLNLEGTANLSNLLVARNLRWVTQLYEWYVANGITPVLVEAEDYMSSSTFVRKIARAVGLDDEKCVFRWQEATEEEKSGLHPMYVKLQETLLGSTGIVEGKARRIQSVKEERRMWKDEFGGEAADLIAELATAALQEYEYLVEKKLKP